MHRSTPNNPTGTPTPEPAVRRVIAEARGLVIIDEAYVDFAQSPGLACEAASLPNVLVCRTFSKAFGLAGLRIGFGLAHPRIIESVEKSRGPYKPNSLAERAAVAALDKDRDWVASRAAEVVTIRARFTFALDDIGLPPLESAANFVFVPTPRAATLAAALCDAGIGVRLFRNVPRFGDGLRITIAPWPIIKRVIEVLRATLDEDPRTWSAGRATRGSDPQRTPTVD